MKLYKHEKGDANRRYSAFHEKPGVREEDEPHPHQGEEDHMRNTILSILFILEDNCSGRRKSFRSHY